MRHLLTALIVLFALVSTATAEDPGDLHRAKRLYAKGLAEFETWQRTLDRKELAQAISHFKDSFTADPNFSKSDYAILSALEELEAGSSESVSESLRELVDNLFDPFVSAGVAAQDVGRIETLGVCMERIRTLEAATNHARRTKCNLADVLPFRPDCPVGGEYRVSEHDGVFKVECTIHGHPEGPAGYAEEFGDATTRYTSRAWRNYRDGLTLLRKAAFANDARSAKEARRKAAHLFLKATREDTTLVEARIGYLQVAEEGKLKPNELDAFVKEFRDMLADPRLRRYGRLAAGDLLDLEIDVRCMLGRLLVAEGVKMYLLNIPAARSAQIDLAELVTKGYLKNSPTCPKGGTITAVTGKSSPVIRCSVHGE